MLHKQHELISGSVKRTVADSSSSTTDMLDHFHFPHRPVNVFNHTLCWNWIVATQQITHAHLVIVAHTAKNWTLQNTMHCFT